MNLKLTLRAAGLTVAALMSAMLFVACSSDEASNDAAPTTATTSEPTAVATAEPTVAVTAEATAEATAEVTAAITVTDAWARGTMEVEDPTSAIYLTVKNSGDADRATSASVPAEIAGMAQLHETQVSGDTMKMVLVEAWEVPAKGMFMAEPGGHHLMLMNIPEQLKPGDMFTATLHFEHAGDVSFMVEVREMDGSMSDMSGMDN